MDEHEILTETLVETENYMVYRTSEPDGEEIHHIELFNMTLHFFKEEWQEFVALMQAVADTE